MRLVGLSTSSRKTWWLGFGLLIGGPALVLAILGLRAVRADRLEREQQSRDRQAHAGRLADASIRSTLTEIELELRRRDSSDQNSTPRAVEDSYIAFFSYERSGPLTFVRDRVYFGDSLQPATRVDWPAGVERLAEQARAAEAQQRTNIASVLYKRISAAEPKLRAWAQLAALHLSHKDDTQLLAEILSDESRGVTDLTPTGLPVALVECAYAEALPPENRTPYADIIRRALAHLRSGRWWLSFEERSFYDQEMRSLLASAGGAADLQADPRLQELASMAELVAAAPLRRDETTRYAGPSQSGAMLILLSPSQRASSLWQGAGLNKEALFQMLDRAMNDAGGSQLGETWVKNDSGETIWGAEAASGTQANSVPLPILPGWTLSFNDSRRSSWLDQRTMLWLGFIAMLIATMLASLLTTVRVVRREAELARMQNDFIAGVSHEFKSPITSVRLLLERMAGGKLSPPSADDYQSAVARELSRLERHVNRLLEAQQIQAGQRQYDFASAPLSEAAADAIDELATLAEAKHIRIKRDLNAELPSVRMDRAAITDVIANLISNAIKYSPLGSEITVATRLDGSSIFLEVSDEGIGIHRGERRRIFNRFYRGKGSHRVSAGGTGLGLALVKATVEAHGGGISVTSEPGKGSRFTISLPLTCRLDSSA